jgi:hypothetical protein
LGLPLSPQRIMGWLWSSLRADASLPYLVWLAAGVIIGSAAWATSQPETKRTETPAPFMAASAAQNVARSLEQFDRRLLAVIDQHQSSQVQSLDAQARNASNFEALQREPYFGFVDVVDKSGQAVAGRPRDANNWSERDYFVALQHNRRDSIFIGGRFSVDNPQAVGFTVSRRMSDGEGNFAGLVVMGVRLAYFRELLASMEINPNQSIMLLRDDGTILLRLPFRLNDVGNKPDPGTPFDIALRTGKTSVIAFDPIDHVERQFAFHPAGTFPLVVSVGTETTGLFNNPTLWWGVVIAASVAGIALLTWWQRQRAAAERSARSSAPV